MLGAAGREQEPPIPLPALGAPWWLREKGLRSRAESNQGLSPPVGRGWGAGVSRRLRGPYPPDSGQLGWGGWERVASGHRATPFLDRPAQRSPAALALGTCHPGTS